MNDCECCKELIALFEDFQGRFFVADATYGKRVREYVPLFT